MQVSYNNNRLTAGGSINTSNHYHGTKDRDVLLENSAPGAFHNSRERFEPPKCHPRTRTHILTKIMDWVVGKVGWDGFIKWIYGPAGAGKSAIAQTIAEMCHARHLLLATFFFSRTDSKRNNENCLVASLAYQVAVNAPATRDAIEAAVERDPAIFQRSIEAQLTTLIINPLTQLSKADTFQLTPVPNLIIIDGLDECNDHRVQQHILHTISNAVRQPNVPLKFLICSRGEPHLTLEFTSLTSEGMASCLSLEDAYEQDADIERYLMDSFRKIATTHPLKAYIPSKWPTNDVISTLVPTVVKYVSSNRDRPTHRLEIILGMQPPRNDRPFAELDALYMGILSFVKDIKTTLRLLGVLILYNCFPKTPEVVGEFMLLDPDEVECMLLDLASVVECLDIHTPIRMLHASFRDFLFDRSRSGEYYIDGHAEIAQLCLSHIEVHESSDCVTCLEQSHCHKALDYAFRSIIQHLSEAEPSANLREALLNTCYIKVLIKHERQLSGVSDLLANFLFFLQSSKFTDTEDLYLQHRNIYDRIIRKRMADFSLDFGSIVGLVFVGLAPDSIGLSSFDQHFTDYFIGGRLSLLYPTLYFRSHSSATDYVKLLTEFITDPGRAGEYAFDGPQCALVARFLLDFFIWPCSERNFFRHLNIKDCSRLLSETGTFLSKASHSDELVTRIDRADINCEFFTSVKNIIPNREEVYKLEESLRTLIKRIGDYLTRVVGLVPIDLGITLRVYAAKYPSPVAFIIGPLHYEGQGRALSELQLQL